MNYRLQLTLFDHTTATPDDHPLLPRTTTHLPPPLDHQLRAQLPRLVLPTSFWQPLPASKPLARPAPTTTTTTTTAIWTESYSPTPILPAIPTAQLYTGASPRERTQSAILDYRFGPLTLLWIDNPDPPMSSSSSSNKPPQTSGTTSLYWGSVHLYREAGAVDSPPTTTERNVSEKESADDEAKVVGLISVPGNMDPAALLGFLGNALESVVQVRMVRDSTPNRTIVLIKFREAADAREFKIMFNGRPFYDTIDSELCQVVPISSIKLKSTSTPPFIFPFSSPDLPHALSGTAPSPLAVELPTCPVCLERMDGNVSGLVQILCQHVYHCSCLKKWGDSRCPVCRSTNYRNMKGLGSGPGQRRGTVTSRGGEEEGTGQFCTVCQSEGNLWICLICGNVGCGRYQGGHAHSHYEDSHHSFAMELETSRVWSYIDDTYVHRLIRNRADGTLVDLPSVLSSSSSKEKDEKEGKGGAGGGGPDREDEVHQDKLEAMGVEYSILMTGQLTLQRSYYEEELGRLREDYVAGEKRLERVLEEREAGRREKKEIGMRLEALEKEREREREAGKKREEKEVKRVAEEEARRKKEKTEAARAKRELEAELEQERAVTKSLSENLGHLRLEIKKRDEETQSLRVEIEDLKEQMRDVMFALTARDQIEKQGLASELAGGDVSVPVPVVATPSAGESAKKKNRKKK